MIEKKFTMNKTAPWHRRMIPPRMSVVPRVKNNGLYLGFLSLLSQTVHSSPTWCEELTYLKRPWCWERLRAGGEGDDRGWDGWMASPTQWTWVWVHSRSWWWTGRPGVLCFMGSQRVRHDWVTELNYSTSLELQAFFTPTPPPHPTLPVLSLSPVSPVSSSTRTRAKKSGCLARK